MRRAKLLLVAGLAVVALVGGGAGAFAATQDEDGVPVTGPDAERAVAAALATVGGGTAVSVERDSEDGATWEVEVRKPDGSSVDVRLDADDRLVTLEQDSETAPRRQVTAELGSEDQGAVEVGLGQPGLHVVVDVLGTAEVDDVEHAAARVDTACGRSSGGRPSAGEGTTARPSGSSGATRRGCRTS